jgi:serine/threonine-protein kinase
VADLVPGALIAGRYKLERLLGEGGMGEVWAATHEITGGRVALKFLKASLDPKDARRRFLREARAATLVDHPNVVPIRDVVEHADTPVLVMDLLTGETLSDRLKRLGSLELGDAARIAIQVVAAVGAAHSAGVIHRALKPEYVFLSRATSSGEVVRVLDFGIAKLVRLDPSDYAGGQVTQSGTLVGTPAYMAPEQVFGEKNLDYRVDIWAIGVMLHETLTGYRPIEGENYGQIAKKLLSGPIVTIATRRPDLPEDVITLVDSMLARERNDRLSELRTVVDVLARYSTAPRPSFGPPRMTLDSVPSGKVPVSDEDIAAMKRAHDVSADTLVAGSDRRTDTPAIHASSTTPSSTATPPATVRPAPARVGLIASGVVLIAALGVGAGVFFSRRGPVTGSSTPPTAATPLVAPTPIPTVIPSQAPTPVTATATASVPEPPPSASTAPSTKPTGFPTGAITAKLPVIVKSAAPPTASVSVAPTSPPTAATPTTTGGLVTKPPF